MSLKKKGPIYLAILLPSWLWCLHDLVLSRLLFEPAPNCRKTNKGWVCVKKVVETKLNVQYIKNILEQIKEIAVFIRARLHETRSELKPVWNLKSLRFEISFRLHGSWHGDVNFPNNSKPLLHICKWYLLINENLINAK